MNRHREPQIWDEVKDTPGRNWTQATSEAPISRSTTGTTANRDSAALRLALEKNQEILLKVEACADGLVTANEQIKKELRDGDSSPQAQTVLSEIADVELKVQACALELQSVAKTLLQGIDELAQTEAALAESQSALADTQAALAAATASGNAARHQALHDAATGLPNRKLFLNRLTQAIAIAERHQWTLAVMFLDLDRFKQINDTLGHAAGDAVLKAVSERLKLRCREEDTVCRYGGDEFLFLLMHPQGQANIERVANAFIQCISQPIDFNQQQISLKASIGISVYPDDGITSEQLIRRADEAMYIAKKEKLGAAFFSMPLAA